MRKLCVILLCLLIGLPARAASLISDTETEKLLTELVAPLAVAADIPDGRLRVHIVASDEFNAFVMGGEDVYIYTGLLQQIKNPSALQAVVAHELGHTLGGHMTQMSARMSAEMTRTMLIQALGIGLMAVGGDPSLGAGVLAGSGGIATQSMLAFTRDEERIADDMGVGLMMRAGLDVNGFIDVFQQMEHMTGVLESKINPNRINHPLTAERLNNVRAQIAKHPDYTPTNAPTDAQNAEYELVRAKLIGYLDNQDAVMTRYPAADVSDAALYARAIARMRSGELGAAHRGTSTLISRAPDNPYYHELMGDALALVLTERRAPGDIDRAISLCKRALLTAPAPLTYWVLARAYDDGRADWARAEYYHMIGKNDIARQYARRARTSLDPASPEYIKSGDILE